MAALGMGLLFIGYAFGLKGYTLIKGYDVTTKQMWSHIWPPGSELEGAETLGGAGAKNLIAPLQPPKGSVKPQK